MFTRQPNISALLAAGACLVAATQANASFWNTQSGFDGAMVPDQTVTSGAGAASYVGAFSFTSATVGGSTTITFGDNVSGVGGAFDSGVSVSFTVWDGTDTLGTYTSTSAGFLGFTTDQPTSNWIRTMTFSGSTPALTFGVDVPHVPEPSTYLAGVGALGMLGMALRRNRK